MRGSLKHLIHARLHVCVPDQWVGCGWEWVLGSGLGEQWAEKGNEFVLSERWEG